MQPVRVTTPATQPPYSRAAAVKIPISGSGHYQLLNRANDNETPSFRSQLSSPADALLETGNVYRSTTTPPRSRTCWQVFRGAETYKTLQKVYIPSVFLSAASLIAFGLTNEGAPAQAPLAFIWIGASILAFATLTAMVTNWALAVQYGLPDTGAPTNISITEARRADGNEAIQP